MSDESLYRVAEKRVDEKIAFYKHLYSFVIVNIILIILNVLFSPGNLWFYWVTIFWGIGLMAHFLKIFLLTGKFDGNRDKMIEKEMEKLKK